jgi:predicted ATPase/DNA-binding CsgD family transcriptional regulator
VGDNEFEADEFYVEPLTQREKEILVLLTANQSNRGIADQLVLSINTVKWYLRQIYNKLGVENRRQAIQRADSLGLIDVDQPKHNLPLPLTPFIGRKDELTEIRHTIKAPDSRLLILTGLGGIGKTRLAIQVAFELIEDSRDLFPDGVYFVSLAPLVDPDSIIPTIARALNFTFHAGQEGPRQQLIDYLSRKRLLLILDNFEHLVHGADHVTDILADTPGITILVTSREPLGLLAESVYEVRGLRYPEDGLADDFDTYPSVALFIQRARRTQPDWSPDNTEHVHIAHLCKLVQGMPLAIELASSWVNTLSCEEIAAEIERNLDILEVQLRDLPERQRSIRAVFDHSWRLMSDDERQVFMKLSVFYGCFTKEAAEKVAGAALATLSALVGKSLIRRRTSGRYELHELIRQFAEERLEDSGEADTVRDLHTAYYAEFMNQIEVDLKGGAQFNALNKIANDLDNIRAAWSWAIEQLDYGAIDMLLESLYLYNIFRRGTIQGDKILNSARERLSDENRQDIRRVWGRVTVRHEMLRVDTSLPEWEEARKNIEISLEIARLSSDISEIAFCLYALGRIATWNLSYTQAISFLEESLKYCQQIEDEFYEAYIHYRLGFCYYLQANQRRAKIYFEQSLDIARRTGNQYVAAWTLNNLAGCIFELGRLEEANDFQREAIRIREDLGDKQGAAWSTSYLGLGTFLGGKYSEAKELSERAISISRDVNHPVTLGQTYAVYAWILACTGDLQGARNYAEQAIPLVGESPDAGNLARFALAYSSCVNRNYPAAKENVKETVRGFRRVGYNSQILNCLPILGTLLAEDARYEESTELLALTFNHPHQYFSWLEKDQIVTELTMKLKEALDEDVYSEAWERGKRLDLDIVVDRVLAGDL